jgi:lysophospholipase L1-like esterase
MRQLLLRATISLVATAVVLEIALRFFGAFLPGWYRTGPLIEPDQVLGWRHIRSSVTWIRQPEFTARFETNAQGRLGAAVAADAPPGGRVVVLGDSFVGAGQMSYERTLTGLLPGLLSASRDVEVVNEGVSGYGTDQAVIALEKRVAPLRPNVTVLVFTVANDVWNNEPALEGRHPTYRKPSFEVGPDGQLQLQPLSGDTPVMERARALLGRSWILSVIKTGVLDPLAGKDVVQARSDQLAVLERPTGSWHEAWRKTSALVRRFAERSRSDGARPLLVIVPDPCQVHDELCGGRPELARSTIPQVLLLDAASAAGLDTVDLLTDFRAHAARGVQLYFSRDLHWTEAGQRLAAELVAPAVRRALGQR